MIHKPTLRAPEPSRSPHLNSLRLVKPYLLGFSLVLALSSKAAYAELADGALLTGTPFQSMVVAPPNIMLLMDNGGSANSEVAWNLITAPGTGVLQPLLTYPNLSTGAARPYTAYTRDQLVPFTIVNGVIYADPTLSYGIGDASVDAANTNKSIAAARSHYGNPTYYNPAWTYKPWNYNTYDTFKSGSTSYTATAAPLDLNSPSLTVDLTKDFKYNFASSGYSMMSGVPMPTPAVPVWQLHTQDNGTALSNGLASTTFRLSTYYVYKYQTTAGIEHLQNTPMTGVAADAFTAPALASYKKVVIRPAQTSYDWYPTRTDCVTTANSCSYAEELENFKNWFVFYRTKLNTQKGTLSWALSRLSADYRIGLAVTATSSNTTIDGVAEPTVIKPLRAFTGSDRSALFDAIFAVSKNTSSALGIKPLRKPYDLTAKYFERTDAGSPWNTVVGTPGGNLSCRPNAVVMLTDGYRNEVDPTLNTAEKVGATVNSPIANISPPYSTTGSPGYERAAFLGNSSLASITHAKHWGDLISTLANSNYHLLATTNPGPLKSFNGIYAYTNAGAPNTAQHIRTFVVGLGMPGLDSSAIPRNHAYRNISRLEDGTYFPAISWGTGSYDSTQQELKHIDDLQQAAANGHGAFIEWQSVNSQMRIDPRVQLLHHLASLLQRRIATPHKGRQDRYDIVVRPDSSIGTEEDGLDFSFRKVGSNSQWARSAEEAVLEDYVETGTPLAGRFTPLVGYASLTGALIATNATGYTTPGASNSTTVATAKPDWWNFSPADNMANSTLVKPTERNIFTSTWNGANAALGAVIAFTPPKAESALGAQTPSTSSYTGELTDTMMKTFFNNDSDLVWFLRGSGRRETRTYPRVDSLNKYPYRNRGLVVDDYPNAADAPTDTSNPNTPKLGPILNSHPVAVKGQDFGYAYNDPTCTDYCAFLKTKRTSKPRVAVGVNDGMFRVFDASAESAFTPGIVTWGTTGTLRNPEELAYIPAGVLQHLKQQAHPYYAFHQKDIGIKDPDYGFRLTVDGPASTGDVKFAAGWRSLVTGSLGGGGKGLFAIDITAGSTLGAASVLWDKTTQGQWTTAQWANVGHIRNRTGIFKMKTGEYAVITGNGSHSDNGSATLFVLNAQTGAVMAQLVANNSGGNGLMGVSFLFNTQREVVAVYGGDLKGNVWKFDVSASSALSWNVANNGSPLLTAKTGSGTAQPITTRPALAEHPDGLGTMVMVGTGSNFRYKDPALALQHTVYGFLDRSTVAGGSNSGTAGRADLVQQELTLLSGVIVKPLGESARTLSSNNVDYNSKKGWYIDLPSKHTQTNTYEAVMSDPRMVGERLVVASATPPPVHGLTMAAAQDECLLRWHLDLLGAVTSIDPFTGGKLKWSVYDINADGKINADDNANVSGYIGNNRSIAIGMPAIVKTGSGYQHTREGDVLAQSRSNAVKSWRQLIPR